MLMIYLQMIETEEDKQLFVFLYENHKKQMHYVANAILHNHQLSEDAVHDAFVGVANHMQALHGRSGEDMKNYLLKAAKHAAINLQKKERKQSDYDPVPACDSTEDSVLEELCKKLELEWIVACISQIREPYNTVLFCHFLMEMEHREIASVLHRKPDAVRQQLCRGKKMLQTMLEESIKGDA